MKNLKTFESFVNKNSINEAISYVLKPTYFSEAGIDTASLPALGDSKFCVIRHDMVVINGTEVYLGNATIGSGQGGLKVSVIGVYDTKDEANTAFKNEIKQKVDTTRLSVAMGNLFNRKFGLSFEEIEGYVAKGTVK